MTTRARIPAPARRRRLARGDRLFYAVSLVVLSLIFVSVLYPMIYVLSSSFSSGRAVSAGRVRLWPVDWSLEGYQAVLRNRDVGRAYLNTALYTLTGTFIGVALCLAAAYPMSRADLPGRGVIMLALTFTMYFSGGMIPSYMLMRNLGIIDTLWVMVLPGAMSVYNMILARTFIQSTIPVELLEAATIDGCGDARYFFRVVLPLSKAIIAVVALFMAVSYWNTYFSALLYLNTRSRMPLQIILREILVANQIDPMMLVDPELQEARASLGDVLKHSLIVVSTVPILCVYPFAQKYFIQGVMIGSLKG